MNKLFFSIISSMIIIFALWTLIGYIQYGDDIVNKHLDLYTMFTTKRVTFDYKLFSKNWDAFVDTIANINNNKIVAMIGNTFTNGGVKATTGFNFVLNAVNAILNPIIFAFNTLIVPVWLLILTLPFLATLLDVGLALFDFIFFPIFI